MVEQLTQLAEVVARPDIERGGDGIGVDGEVALGRGGEAVGKAGKAVVGEAREALLEISEARLVAERAPQLLAHAVAPVSPGNPRINSLLNGYERSKALEAG
ncbi:MAG TPA: hypothetical protein VFX51_06105 [Solirubrobacteraceae bacterium]|nr:hypothetical protein [Solirubrobacteraceae bacterium]